MLLTYNGGKRRECFLCSSLWRHEYEKCTERLSKLPGAPAPPKRKTFNQRFCCIKCKKGFHPECFVFFHYPDVLKGKKDLLRKFIMNLSEKDVRYHDSDKAEKIPAIETIELPCQKELATLMTFGML